MKKMFLIGYALMGTLFIHNTIAQDDPTIAKSVTVEDITKEMSKGEQPGFKVNVFHFEKKEIENAWSKEFRKDTKAKVERVNNEFSIIGTILKEISVKPVNAYAIFNQYTGYIELNVFFELDSTFLTQEKNETAYLAAKKFLRDFAVDVYRKAVKKEIEDEKKKLNSMESDFKKLVKENDNLHKNTSGKDRSIDNIKEKVATSELDQERVRNQVQSNKEDLARLKDANSGEEIMKAAEKKLKDSEKELSKLQKQEDGMHKDIDKNEAAIRDNNREIKDNELSMNTKQEDIAKQKDLINKLGKKLESIK